MSMGLNFKMTNLTDKAKQILEQWDKPAMSHHDLIEQLVPLVRQMIPALEEALKRNEHLVQFLKETELLIAEVDYFLEENEWRKMFNVPDLEWWFKKYGGE